MNVSLIYRVSALFAVFLAVVLGVSLGVVVSELRVDSIDSKGAVWGSMSAAVIACWKTFMGSLISVRDACFYLIGKLKQFDHFKAIADLSILFFALSLGFLTCPDLFKDRKKTDISYVYIHHSPLNVDLSYIPIVTFKSAALKDTKKTEFTDANITIDVFNEKSVTVTEKQSEIMKKLLDKWAAECVEDGASNKLEIKIQGFSNDMPFLNEEKKVRGDSNFLNEALANLRGRSVYDAVSAHLKEKYPSLYRDEFVVKWEKWPSLEEMKRVREAKFISRLDSALSPSIDHRSVILSVIKPGRCNYLRFNKYGVSG
ncbi:MAG: hypothetical protein OIF55_19750 [Amphritea sp.]|nr:hypothetical protein [Amphritea sp.]